ncbi:CynX/NimT family MFS transporter [Antribacter gilvus]|uniref:MFS transporter n=1 Tax=Antribacter gilvus TaxID=2304675 RepID=UPI000F79471D|nr:MFS transporter [Antribacter gilvus]
MSSFPRRAVGSAALLGAVLVFALNLRAPVTAVPPVVTDVAAALHLDPAMAGLLTGLPVLCFAVVAPAASALIARVGPYRAVTVALVGVLAGTLLRSVGTGTPGAVAAFSGTVVIGAAITIGNVAVPVIVARDFKRRAALATGLYTSSLNLGSVFTTTLTVPLAALLGWQGALASWSVLAVVALVWWLVVSRRLPDAGRAPRAVASPSDAPASGSVLRRAITWVLAAAFCGQAFSYFAVTGWLPDLLGDLLSIDPAAAGGAASLFQALAILGGVAVPAALATRVPMRGVAVAMAAMWLSLPVGLLLAPEAWALWCSLAGVAQGGNFAVIFTLVAQRTDNPAQARRTAATVQLVGYACAATGPSVLGAVHAATHGWDAPLLVVLGALTTMAAAMIVATARRRPPATARG